MKTRIMRFHVYKVTRTRTHIDVRTSINGHEVRNKTTIKGWDKFLYNLNQDLTAMYEECGMHDCTIILKTKK